MLAYVFWHWPRPDAGGASYERALADFHRVLAAAGADWFHGSASFRGRGLPWLPIDGWAYEDWYLVEASFALDALNEIAVSGARLEPHQRVAGAADGGTGGLYRLRTGSPEVAPAPVAAWFAKPRATGYEDFHAQLRPWTDRPGVSLWMRQMTLGPAPEFCLRSPVRLDLPPALAVHLVEMEAVWPPEPSRG